jgi:F-type H+-transporting ATPase subunit a
VEISPDSVVIWSRGAVKVNATILVTWLNMILLAAGAAAITWKLSPGERLSRWQNLLEVLVEGMERQIEEIGLRPPREFLPFLGTLFIFVLFSNLLTVLPGYRAPTGSLSTTAALAFCVFIAIPVWGIRRRGLSGYFRMYLTPTVFMLPFNVIGEVTRTLALAVRLFGNIMSGGMIAAILLTVAPLIFPVVMNLLGLITGVIQAYIFTVLSAVYIAAAVRVQGEGNTTQNSEGGASHG